MFVLTNQLTPAALEWGFGGRWESGLPVEPCGMPHGGVAANAAVGGDCPSGGISVCKSVCARGLCVCLRA